MRSMTSAASSSGPGRLAALATAAAWLAAALCSVPPAALAAGSKDGTDPAALDRPVLGELMAETGFYQSMTLKSGEPLYSARSEYQKIEIVEAVHYGKVLVLDGVVQLTERDAASYNEMMAHVAMMAHPDPRRVLVIGGGDGYVLSEVLKHPSVERVDHVDLDEFVIEVCREHFPWGSAWEDPRVTLHVADGAEFVRGAAGGSYDVVVQDSSDPFTWDSDGNRVDLPSNVLYSRPHMEEILRVLSPGGALNLQAETFQIPSDLEGIVEWRAQAMDLGYADARYGSLIISSYPTGQIGFLLCTKSLGGGESPPSLSDIEERYTGMVRRGQRTAYYQPKLQFSSFDLPLWVEEAMYGTSIISQIEGEGDEL